MKVAIVHYWLVAMRGGEKVVEALLEMFPEADIFTLVYAPSEVSSNIRKRRVNTSFLQKLPGVSRYYTSLLPLMPMALEQFDLTPYDLVISSEAGPAKGVITRPGALHVCYCHSPMRYIWDQFPAYYRNAGRLGRAGMVVFGPSLRQWDVTTAHRVDYFIANSAHVAQRIHKFYRRDSTVVHPPVDTDTFTPNPQRDDYYICAGQLVAYKRIDLAVDAFTRMNKRLIVIGTGELMETLKARAGPTISFAGWLPKEELVTHFARCRALIMPGEEDFGIAPVEVMACGRPVIAYGRGGVLDTVIPDTTGVLFPMQTVESLVAGVSKFEAIEHTFDVAEIRQQALRFCTASFKAHMARALNDAITQSNRGSSTAKLELLAAR